MNEFGDMALDAGYRGDEARRVAAELEQQAMEQQAERDAERALEEQRAACEYAGHDFVDAGGGLQVCACGAERWVEEGK